MSACAEFRRLGSRALDQDLDPAEEARLQAHLADCGACRAFQRDLAETRRRVQGLEAVEPPPWMAARIMARIRAEAAPRPGLWRGSVLPLLRRPQVQAATVLLVCATGYALLRTPARPGLAPHPLQEESPAPAAKVDGPGVPAPGPGRVREPRAPALPREQAPRKVEEGYAPAPAQDAEARVQAEAPRALPAPAPPAAPAPALGASGKVSPEAREERQAPAARKAADAAPAAAQAQAQTRGGAEAKQGPAPGARPQLVFWEPRDPGTAEQELGQILAGLGADLSPDPSRERQDALQGRDRPRTLSARLEARRLPELLARLGRLGTVRAPGTPPQGPGTLTVQIQWTGERRD